MAGWNTAPIVQFWVGHWNILRVILETSQDCFYPTRYSFKNDSGLIFATLLVKLCSALRMAKLVLKQSVFFQKKLN